MREVSARGFSLSLGERVRVRERILLTLTALLALSACGFDVPLGFDDAGTTCGDAGLGNFRPDPTFGTCGTVALDVGALDNVVTGTQGLAVDAQGRAYLAGTTGAPIDRNIGVVRLNPDGTRDMTFGTSGVAEVSVTPADEGHGVLLQPDGTIIISGNSKTTMNEPIPVLGKLSSAGIPDINFGMSGHMKVSAVMGASGVCIGTWRRPSDGAIACSGTAWRNYPGEGDLALVAIDPNTAVPLTAYGTNGAAMIDYGFLDQNGAVAVNTADGKVLLPGYSEGPTQRDFALARLDSNGALDPSFTDSRALPGRISVDFNGGDDDCRAVLPLADGSAWCVGSSRLNPSAFGGAIIKVLPTGALDPSFGNGGKLTLPAFTAIWAVVQLDDGRFLIGGDSASADVAQALQILDANGGESSAVQTMNLTPGADSVRQLVIDAQGRVWIFGVTNGVDWSIHRWIPAGRRMMGVASDCSSAGTSVPLLLLLGALVRRRGRTRTG